MSVTTLLVVGVVVTLVLGFVQVLHLAWIIDWGNKQTEQLGYFGRTETKRQQFRDRLRLHRLLLSPVLVCLARLTSFRFEQSAFNFKGVSGPKGSCSEESFQRAAEYEPQPNDVFVVSQMKSGTTWLQQLVIQVLTRGENSPIDRGATLYSISPWLESTKSVTVEDAPLVQAHRVIKTHLPEGLCPVGGGAKYIYVARHPASCFASCVDFVSSNLGGMAPDLREFERWFTDEGLMWWGSWSTHVAGWWKQAQQNEGVLFVTFEEMRADLPLVARRIASFLDLPELNESELEQIATKCSFEFMKARSTQFEMHPPHVLQADGHFFVSGKSNRFLDTPADVRQRVFERCRAASMESGFPFDRFYGEDAVRTLVPLASDAIPQNDVEPASQMV